MPRRVLDSNILISFWNDHVRRNKGLLPKPSLASAWADELIAIYDSRAILTPILVEVIAGTTSRIEAQAWTTFLASFDCVDQRRILPDDWRDAIQKAKRIPRDGRRRNLGDCLIKAVADRLGYDLESHDSDFRH